MPVEGTPTVDLLEKHTQLQEDYENLLYQLKWSHAVVSILVELEGGLVVIPKTTLENYDLGGTVRVRETADGNAYSIEVVPPVIEGEIV